MRAGGLRHFIFMVRKHQVRAAAVNIKVAAKLLAVHGGALDVPARTTVAPRRFPRRLIGFGHLPQHEIHRVAFYLCHFHTGTRLQLLQILTRQRAIIGIAQHIKHHIAVLRHVGVTAFNQPLHQLNNFRDMARGAWFQIRRQNAQCGKILVHLRNHAVGQRLNGFAIFVSAANNFVINISDITHILQLIANIAQVTRHHVKCHKRTPVADMTEVVNRNTTHVHADFTSMNRFKFLFLSTQGVIDL